MRYAFSGLLLLGLGLALARPAQAMICRRSGPEFRLGAEAYQRGDYRLALEEFLGSNRLVQNRKRHLQRGALLRRAEAVSRSVPLLHARLA